MNRNKRDHNKSLTIKRRSKLIEKYKKNICKWVKRFLIFSRRLNRLEQEVAELKESNTNLQTKEVG